MRLFILLTSVLFFIACSTTRSKIPFYEQEGLPLDFKIEGVVGKQEHVIYSASNTQTFQNDQILREQSEIVEFKTVTDTTAIAQDSISQTVTTVSKDGPIDLLAMGYPEVGESLDYIIAKDGDVIKAGKYPLKSLFYIPQLPFPKKPILKGETWTYTTDWVSDETLSLLSLTIVLVLKDIKECMDTLCVDVQYSGHIQQPKDSNIKIPFKSSLKGTMTYNLKMGQIIYGLQTNQEEIKIEGARVQATSCTEIIHTSLNKKPFCNPLKLPTLDF